MQLQLQLHYIKQHYTTLITLHYITTATTTTLHYTTLHYNYTTLHYNALDYTTLHYTTLQYTTLQYTTMHYPNYTTPQLQLQLQLHYTNYTTLQLQLETTTPLHYNYTYNCATHTTSSSCGEVTTATIAATPENTTSTTFQSISGFALPALPSVIHNNQPLL